MKTKTKVIVGSLGICIFSLPIYARIIVPHFASAEETTFEVNVVESLSVSLTTPSNWASGNITTFLKNDINLTVTSNNASGFTASMYANAGGSSSTSLMNSTYELPNLENSIVRSSFPANHWGYSLGASSYSSLNTNTYGETSGTGTETSNYYPLPNSTSPVTIMNSSSAASGASRDIYFGARGGMSQASGTYTGTVVISVVSGITDEGDTPSNPVTPTNPATPTNDVPNDGQATYTGAGTSTGGGTNGTTVYTTRTSNPASGNTPATETTTTEVSDGDVREIYADPAGVIENTTSNISDRSQLATSLVVASSAAAASGMLFFIIAKRREEEDEEEEEI